MKKTRIIALFTCAILCFTCLFGCGNAGTDYTAKNEEYVIGVSGPLTGGAAVYGKAVENSANMAIEEINAAGGLNGIKFKLIATNDMHDATKVSANYASMLEGGMQVSLGTVTTAPGLEYTKLSVEDNVFFLTPSASGDDIPKFENGYQMCFADSNQGAVAAEYVNQNYKGKTIGAFYKSDDAYSTGIWNKFKDNLKGVEVVETSFNDSTAQDFTSQIDKLKDYEFIFMPIYYEPASLFMKQAKTKVAADAVYYGCDGFDGIDSIEGFDINSIPQEVTMLSHFNSKSTEGKAGEFIKKYTEKYGKDTLNQFGASAYDCVYAIYNAMKAAIDSGKEIPVTISATALSDILKEQFTGGFTFSGVTGEDITWESTGYVKKDAVKYVIKEATK